MRLQSIIVVVIGYFFGLCLLFCPLINNISFKKCLESGLINYEYQKLRIEAQRGSSIFSADVLYNNKSYYLHLQEKEYQKAKEGIKIQLYYCKKRDEIFSEYTIWVNKRVSLMSVFFIIFWTAMLKWVFIPYEKKQKSKNDYLIVKSS